MEIDKEQFNLVDYVQMSLMKESAKRENAALENILRNFIDNSIVGEITPEKLKASNVQGIIRRKFEALPEIQYKEKSVVLTFQSNLLGISQNDMLIMINGARMPLSDIPYEWYEMRFIYETPKQAL